MKTEITLRDPDAVYEALMDAHLGLSGEQSQLLDAQLILLLANQVGDDATVDACIRAAREGVEMPPPR
ncbi:DUF2783 domain-containing protein [Variovorax paradoxus]|uniref:DUF2783 domain-containing protein n=1 Tax=Variovorax paradoxus TaxID=34073 RepID=UPI002786FFCD|nr:DUF2783 domain-containing protein [Variovorax paradoxus]MDQ0589926.1 hypothetical protein [Variovorax paradoxus]